LSEDAYLYNELGSNNYLNIVPWLVSEDAYYGSEFIPFNAVRCSLHILVHWKTEWQAGTIIAEMQDAYVTSIFGQAGIILAEMQDAYVTWISVHCSEMIVCQIKNNFKIPVIFNPPKHFHYPNMQTSH
jgi:hypothetical protein